MLKAVGWDSPYANLSSVSYTHLGLVEGKSLENGVAYRFTVDVTAGVSSAVLTVEKVER